MKRQHLLSLVRSKKLPPIRHFPPADEEDLSWFLSARPNVPVTILGGGSNVLIRDGGV